MLFTYLHNLVLTVELLRAKISLTYVTLYMISYNCELISYDINELKIE